MSNYLSAPVTSYNDASQDTENRDQITGRSPSVENYPVLNVSSSATFSGTRNSAFSGADHDYFVIDLNNDGVGSVAPGTVLNFTITNSNPNANFAIQWRLVDTNYLQTTGPYGQTQFYLQYSSQGAEIDYGDRSL